MVNKKILVFSDFDSVRTIIVKSLVNIGYEVIESKNYSDALSQLNGINYGLVITDDDIKDKDGIKIIEYMREQTSYMYTPIILLHSKMQDQLKIKYAELKIACYLGKPFDMQKFHSIVGRLA